MGMGQRVVRGCGLGWVEIEGSGGGGGRAGGHCLVKLKEERWHAVSLSWRSPLNALAPPDISYSEREGVGGGGTAAPAACQGIPPLNWALTRDSFHSAPRASPRAGENQESHTKLGLVLLELRGGWDPNKTKKKLTFRGIIPVSPALETSLIQTSIMRKSLESKESIGMSQDLH